MNGMLCYNLVKELYVCAFLCSETEMTTSTDKKKKKRRKTIDKSPRVTVLSYEEADQEVECRLELSNKNTITFKFALKNDMPEEIADNLVRVFLFYNCYFY